MNQENTLLECPVCMEYYVYPKILSNCGHTVCGKCVRLISKNNEDVQCPICNKLSLIETLNTNYVVQDLVNQLKNNKNKYRVNLSFSCPEKDNINNSIHTQTNNDNIKDDAYVIARPVLSHPVNNNNGNRPFEIFQFDEELDENKRECCNLFL